MGERLRQGNRGRDSGRKTEIYRNRGERKGKSERTRERERQRERDRDRERGIEQG